MKCSPANLLIITYILSDWQGMISLTTFLYDTDRTDRSLESKFCDFLSLFIRLEMSKKSKKSPKIDQKHEKYTYTYCTPTL